MNPTAHRFYDALLGWFSPGQPIAFVSTESATQVDSTGMHELVHQEITMGSSLGSLACAAGLLLRHSRKNSLKLLANNYIKSFVANSVLIQEGAATASLMCISAMAKSQNFNFQSLEEIQEKAREDHLLEAREQINHALATCKEIHWENESLWYFALKATLCGLVMAAMSPQLEICHTETFSTDIFSSSQRLCQDIWNRYLAMLRVEPALLAKTVATDKRINNIASKWSFLVDFPRIVAQKSCLLNNLSYSPALHARKVVEQFDPELRGSPNISEQDFFFKMSESEQDMLLKQLREEAIFPNLNYPRSTLSISQLPDVKRMYPIINWVTEVNSQKVGGIEKTNIILHGFDGSAEHLMSWLVLHSLDDRQTLNEVLRNFPLQGIKPCCGVVVGLETRTRHLQELFNGIPTFNIALNPVGIDAEKIEIIGQWNGVELQRIRLTSGELCWRVVPSLFSAAPPLSAAQQIYAWVAKNSITSLLRWDNLTGSNLA